MRRRNERQRLDAAVARGYLGGSREFYQKVDSWIVQVIDGGYGSLRHKRDDLRQTVHERLVRVLSLDRFGYRSALRTFVTSMTHHVCIDMLRKEGREVPLQLDGEEVLNFHNVSRDSLLEQIDARRLVHRLFRELSEMCRELWRMTFYEGMAYSEIAQKLQIPQGTVKSRMWKCRQQALESLRFLDASTAKDRK